jgi:DNA-binding LacI/PurR family transcriptional regulator
MVDSRRLTIRDVARKAGVSESTVSRVLSRSQTQIAISPETRERVLQVVEELDYRPNPVARALRGKRTNVLGLIVREIDDLFFAQLTDAIRDLVQANGYDLVLGYAKSDPEEALLLSEVLDLRRCDGLFLLGDLKESPNDPTFLADIGKGHPVISLGRGSRQLVHHSPSVSVDNLKGTYLGLQHLADLGHRRIAFVAGHRLGDLWERVEAYDRYMAERFGGRPQSWVQSGENNYEGGREAMTRLLSLVSPPTAVFAADDTMAIGALKAAWDMGYAVPRDLSVVGFDDIKIAQYLHPALTTIRQPIARMAHKAFSLLLSMVKGQTSPTGSEHLVVDPELVVRDSCAPPRAERGPLTEEGG